MAAWTVLRLWNVCIRTQVSINADFLANDILYLSDWLLYIVHRLLRLRRDPAHQRRPREIRTIYLFQLLVTLSGIPERLLVTSMVSQIAELEGGRTCALLINRYEKRNTFPPPAPDAYHSLSKLLLSCIALVVIKTGQIKEGYNISSRLLWKNEMPPRHGSSLAPSIQTSGRLA